MLLSEVIRDNTRNAKLKQSVLPALGELLYLVAVQEEQRPSSIDAWSVPSLTYTVLSRCLRDAVSIHYNKMKMFQNMSNICNIFPSCHNYELCNAYPVKIFVYSILYRWTICDTSQQRVLWDIEQNSSLKVW